MTGPTPITLAIEPLTAGAFQSFGDVIEATRPHSTTSTTAGRGASTTSPASTPAATAADRC
jgi:ureidoglycolate hydrolase